MALALHLARPAERVDTTQSAESRTLKPVAAPSQTEHDQADGGSIAKSGGPEALGDCPMDQMVIVINRTMPGTGGGIT